MQRLALTLYASGALALFLADAALAQGAGQVTGPAPAQQSAAAAPKVLQPAAGRPPLRRQLPPMTASPGIQAMRSLVASSTLVKNSKTPPASWSTTLSPAHLNFKGASNLSLKTSLHNPDYVESEYATWDGAGSVSISTNGLNPGSAYVVGCTILSWQPMPEGFPVEFKVGNQTTTIESDGGTFTGSMAFIAPDGFAAVTIMPQLATPWGWTECTFGTAK